MAERKSGVDKALAAGHEAWAESGNNPVSATSLYRAWLSKQEDLTAAVTFQNIDDMGRIYNADKDLGWPGGRTEIRCAPPYHKMPSINS